MSVSGSIMTKKSDTNTLLFFNRIAAALEDGRVVLIDTHRQLVLFSENIARKYYKNRVDILHV